VLLAGTTGSVGGTAGSVAGTTGSVAGTTGSVAGTTGAAAGTAGSAAPFGVAVGEACTKLGARVRLCSPDVADEASVDETVAAAVADTGSLDLLVVDGAGLFARGALHTCLDASWNVTRAVVQGAFMRAERGGRIVYLAPAPDAGQYADAARAGLDNLSRTLSVEWARHGITVVTIVPGERSTAGEVAALTAYLASPAGAYFSGCVLDLRGV
jgi:NAD(P)-dependent dehydrogenase (short-subunit alcohol dehydrogenase family)